MPGSAKLRSVLSLTAIAAALLAAGCGGGEKEFDAESVVAQLNDAGAGLTLGETLPATAEGVDVRVVTFGSAPGVAAGDELGAGAVVILDDAAAAGEEFDRCQAAVDFTCYRAANAVLRFTAMTQDEQARVTEAVRAMESDG
jgi:hypothetical protein